VEGPRNLSDRRTLTHWTKVQYSLVATVLEILATRPGGLCFESVLTKTGLRADHALREIDAVSLGVTDGHCGGCGEAGPVFAHATGGLLG
jgi:hypothetical protein